MSKKKKKDKKPVEVIVFEDPEKKWKEQSEKSTPAPTSKPSPGKVLRPEFNQRKAKYEIRKLAIHGMDKKEDKETAMTDFLVELGARKPKGKHVSIKEYMMLDPEKRKALGKDKEDLSDDEKPKKTKVKRKRDKDDVLDFLDGQIGTYRKGVQFIKPAKKAKK